MRQRARLIVLGRQGAGKGTQCGLLAEQLGVPHLSTGDLLRAEKEAGTDLGRRTATFVEAGELVPDDLILELVTTYLGGPDGRANGYVLDGFPRTLAQGQAMFDTLGAASLDVAIELHVPTSVVLPRLAARRVCRRCGTTSVAASGDPEARACELCGGVVARREDDTDEAIARRLALYDEQTNPLLIWLDSRRILTSVDGVGSPPVVHHRLLAAVRAELPAAGLVDVPETSDLAGAAG